MSEQLVFDLPHRPALGADDFFVSSCNALAVALIDAWPDWRNHVHAITGPAAGGKTHLAHVWSHVSAAKTLDPDSAGAFEAELSGNAPALIIEDLDRRPFSEAGLFHLLNSAHESRKFLLLTARQPPAQWTVALPDLASRLRSIPVVAIGAPDDSLLSAALVKQFADRQLDVDPAIIRYLTQRIERSMAVVGEVVALVDQMALGSGRRITRALAAEALELLPGRQTPDA